MKRTSIFLLIAVFALSLSGCTASPVATADPENILQITARGLEFEAPDEIPSGWTTVRLTNESEMHHFAAIQRLPEGIGIEDQQQEVAPVFQEGMNLLNQGEVDAALAKFGELPAWFGDVVFTGGPGLIAPGETAEATVFLEPGTYLMECYVKTGGIFHSYNPSPDAYGMVHEITVTEESAGAPEPTADIELTLSSEQGIEVEGNVSAGEQTIAIHFEDQTVHEHFLGHDVHLVRLPDDSDLEELATWMDWTQPAGLETSAPARFLGGTHEMPAGQTAYVTFELEPGSYAWIAEVPNPAGKGMLKTFSVE